MNFFTTYYGPRRGLDLIDSFFGEQTFESGPKSKIHKNNHGYEVHMVVPGVSKDDVSVDIENNLMTVSYNQRKEQDSPFAVKSFSRSWKLPRSADIGNITASSENGILTINVPNREDSKSEKRKINIT